MDAGFFNVCNDLFECYSTFSFVVAFLPEMNLYLYRFICTHYFLDRVEFLFSCTLFPKFTNGRLRCVCQCVRHVSLIVMLFGLGHNLI